MTRFIKIDTLITLFLLGSSVIFITKYMHFFEFTPEALGKYVPVKWVLMAHIAGGATALLAGPFQLLKAFREKRWKLHRWLGYFYLGTIALSAMGALWLTLTTTDQVSTLYTLALRVHIFIWLMSTFMAYWTIRKKRIQHHEEWMVRSYIATFAFVLQNFMIKIPALLQLGSFPEVFPNFIWFSWSFPLLVYQVYLTQVSIPKTLKKSA